MRKIKAVTYNLKDGKICRSNIACFFTEKNYLSGFPHSDTQYAQKLHDIIFEQNLESVK